MPVTAKLSRKFYDQFGDEIANELVDWFYKVDDTYRSEFRELNELNYARFDAKLEQRLAEFVATLRTEIAAGDAALRVEIAELGGELRAEIAAGDAALRAEIAALGGALRAEIGVSGGSLRAEMATMKVELHKAITDSKSDLMRWMFGLWATQMVVLVGVILAILQRGP